LPHFDGSEITQSVTFRLADSFPRERLEAWKRELQALEKTNADRELRRRIEAYMDAGSGECWLRDPRIASIVRDALRHFEGTRYRQHAWVVMPNHVHTLFTPLMGFGLSEIIHSWKSFTAKLANRTLGRAGKFWAEDYFDRFIRDEEHFHRVLAYIEENPVKAGLCSKKEDWPFSSASRVQPHDPGSAGILPA
jgi:REP element-mobilizing transposase RayT